jgi:SagB-type dehydrogenase family enzyme
VEAEARRCVIAQGYGVRALPVPPHLRADAVALVPAEHGREVLDLAASAIPVWDIAVARDRAEALWRVAAAAATRRLRRRSPAPPDGARRLPCFGAGPDRGRAAARAVYTALAYRWAAAGDWQEVTRILGWEASLPVLRGIDGGVSCYRFGVEGGVTVMGAVLRLAGEPVPWCGLAADAAPRRALSRAVDEALRAYLAGSLPAAGNPGRRDVALVATGELEYPKLAVGPVDESLDGLGAGLRRHGVRAEVRTVGPPSGATVVGCRLRPEPAGSGGPWTPSDVASMGLRAPAQLSLGYRRDDVRVSRLYHENSKLRTGFGTLPLVDAKSMAVPVRRLIGRGYRDYRHASRAYPLPPAGGAPLPPLDQVVRRRRSWAPMAADSALTLGELGQVLTLVYGTTGSAELGGGVRQPLRATPSAGGLYSCDLYLLVDRVEGVDPGVYYFQPMRRALQLVRSDRSLAEVARQTGYQERVSRAAVLVVYVGAFRRNQWKYHERGYRAVLLDCGHVGQSVVTAAGAVSLVAHPMIAFADDYFNELVGVDGVDDAVLYLTLLGRPAATPEDGR